MIKAIICDDHAIVRRGLRQILVESGRVEVVGEAANYRELRTLMRDTPCQVLLCDIEMPGRNGIEIAERVSKESPQTAVIVLSIYPEDQYAIRALKAGASGYLNKNSAPEKLLEAVLQVAAGKKYISPEVSQSILSMLSGRADKITHQSLSDREFQVMRLIASGKKLSEIAEALALSPKTVSVYRSRILEKLNLANNVEIAHYASKNGLI
jgi:two-component system, NarL family, invasion response regulator UvrY